MGSSSFAKRNLIAQCLAKYRNELENLKLNGNMLLNYTAYMLEEIERLR